MLALLQNTMDPQQSWWEWLVAGGVVGAIMLSVWVINRLLPERMRKGYTAGAGNALMRAETFFRPSREYVIEAKQQEHKEEDDEGGPDKSGHAHKETP